MWSKLSLCPHKPPFNDNYLSFRALWMKWIQAISHLPSSHHVPSSIQHSCTSTSPRHPSTRRRSQILCADPILHSEHHQVTDCLTMCSVSKLGVWERQSPVPFSAQWRIPGNCKSMIIGVFFICRNCSPSSNTALGGGQPRIRILLLLRALLNDWPVLWLAVCNVHLWFLPPSNQPHPGATHGVDEPTT